MPTIHYRAGYKYQLSQNYLSEIPLHPPLNINSDFISLGTNGELSIWSGYAWDGPSGIAFDTKTFMRASLVHDALYQLIREQRLDETYKDAADSLMRTIAIEDGMSAMRAGWCYRAVQKFGHSSATAGNTKPVLEAP